MKYVDLFFSTRVRIL